MLKYIVVFLMSAAVVSAASAVPVSAQDCGTPPELQAIYDSLAAALDQFDASLNPGSASGNTRFGAELLTANSNRGEQLLERTTLPATELYLDRLQGLGFDGVSVQIAYPLLLPDYPRSQEYLAFYQAVAEAVHERGMKLMVETGPVFAGTIFSDVEVNYAGVTAQDYFAQKRDMLVLIASEVRPDYLALSNEPGTEAMLTGLQFTVDEYVQNIEATLAAIDRPEGMLVGAGAGSWEDGAYFDRFVNMLGLDFINIHIYPLVGPRVNYLERVLEQSERARANGKRVIVGEAWLYKTQPSEFANLQFQEIYPRDMYCFWSPLDIRFIETLLHLANDQDFEYVSFYWSQYFFAYADYTPDFATLPARQRYTQLNRAVYDNLRSGTFSATGLAVQRLLNGAG
jgi:hypothetical protein